MQLDNLIGISSQRNQLIIFISHHSRKLDLNVIHEVDRIFWKEPTYAHQLFERDELSDFTMRAYDFLHSIGGEKAKKKATLVMDFHNLNLRFLKCNNNLPPWWSDDLSRLLQDVQRIGKGVLSFLKLAMISQAPPFTFHLSNLLIAPENLLSFLWDAYTFERIPVFLTRFSICPY